MLYVLQAVDPYLGTLFPALINFYSSSATVNDTFVAGVDGAGYIFVDSLGVHAASYEKRAAAAMAQMGLTMVDVGVAQEGWPATTLSGIEAYVGNSGSAPPPRAFLNACGSSWGQPLTARLKDGVTPVINSVCIGPKQNDTSDGHYLYYYRDHLNQSDPAGDLAHRIAWAATHYSPGGSSSNGGGGGGSLDADPVFLLVFGGLGLYGGHDDFFLFLQNVMMSLHVMDADRFVAVGAPEMTRLARSAAEPMNRA